MFLSSKSKSYTPILKFLDPWLKRRIFMFLVLRLFEVMARDELQMLVDQDQNFSFAQPRVKGL